MTATDRKFIIFTWGCQMNEDDAEQIASLLMQMGYSPTDVQEEADVAVLVTCSVREKPEQKAKSKLGELRLAKESNPSMIIGVCGCMAQKEGEQLRKHRSYLDFVVGTASISRIPDLICEVHRRRGFRSALEMPRSAMDALNVPPRTTRQGVSIKSFVPVMYGCDNYCTYCVVPYVRGKERSRELTDIVREVSELAQMGRKEVTLLGQNVNSYGLTLREASDFSELLRAVSDVDGIERIRFTTSHPKDLSDKLIGAIRDLPKVCEHIHLAVQSGDDEILARMNRRYSSAHIRERVAALRSAVPEIAITTDFLVGFPGETEEQFANTLRLAEEVRFDSAFMFAFNPIPNTAAAGMGDQVSESVKNERLNRLIKVQNTITCEVNCACIGNSYEVLVEGVSPKDARRLTGLTRQNKTMNFPGSSEMIGKKVCVRVTEGHLYGFVGAGGDSGR
jgi:tRNA-2-methylthio-N6-dimethylallyladenosine synthase